MSQQSIFTSHSEIFRSRLAAAFSSFAARSLSLGDAELHHNTSAGCFVQFQATFSNFFYCVIQIFLALLIFCHTRNNVMKMANCGVQGIELAPVSEVPGLGEQGSLSQKGQRFP